MNNKPVAWMSNGKEFYVQKNYCPDFIPLYTHPVKEQTTKENHVWDKGIWTVGQTESQEFIESSDFNHDVRLYLNGDFEDDTQRLNYLKHIADRLNTHPVKELTDEEIMKLYDQDDLYNIDEGQMYLKPIEFARAILRKASEK